MSTAVMALCWPLAMPPTAKAVLISLADNANDHGECWPSLATISMRTCFSERAVQNAIRWLELAGAVVADRSNGRHTRYHVTPAGYSPPQEMHPAAGAAPPPQEVRQPPQEIPKPPQQVPSNRKEPSRTVKSNRKDERARTMLAELPDGLAADFLAVRKAKRAPLTDTAFAGIEREAFAAGVSLETAIRTCVENNWIGFKADWYANLSRKSGAPHATNRQSAADRVRANAIAGELADRANGHANLVGPDGGDLWPPLD